MLEKESSWGWVNKVSPVTALIDYRKWDWCRYFQEPSIQFNVSSSVRPKWETVSPIRLKLTDSDFEEGKLLGWQEVSPIFVVVDKSRLILLQERWSDPLHSLPWRKILHLRFVIPFAWYPFILCRIMYSTVKRRIKRYASKGSSASGSTLFQQIFLPCFLVRLRRERDSWSSTVNPCKKMTPSRISLLISSCQESLL
jgi:hypothetical protein